MTTTAATARGLRAAEVPARTNTQARTIALDIVIAVVIVIAAVALRWPFIETGAPMFVTPDSESYLLPGWELAHGQGFNPELRRTPVYSVFIAGVVSAVGGNLERLATAQHLLGVLTALIAGAF